ncbi:hypothetical protein N9425_01705 [Gammaproteobacteria bacterium]|nr:hypothetical protein [Gammaproteobacteria bacterium]|tara:strand:+ start:1489 stop:1896 length:408 start_codon:yes stop_codon:yes gene_type:complete
MEINQSVMDMWNLMGIFMVSNAIYFAACAFLIWVGFRFTNNIYNSPDTIIIAKILTTIFCLSVGMFTLGNMSAGTELFKDVADVFISLQATGVEVGPAAERLIEQTANAPTINLIQLLFLGSVVLMQLAQIWIKK